MLTISLAIIAVNSTRPENILPQILILEIGILVSYLIIPTRFVFQVITAAVSSIGQFALMLTALDTQVLTTNQIIIFSILFSNIIGAVTSWQIHSYRWKLFQNHVKTKQSERLVAIGQTAGMVGHDIRNPLQAIVSDLYLLSDDVQSIPQTENRQSAIESIEAMNENLNYINKIVSDLQDYSRAAKPQIEEVDLSALIKKTLDKLNPPQNIKLDSTLRPDVKIDADSAHLKRIMINLLTNAIQAMPNGGALTIAMESIDNVVRIIISDTGDGIPEGTREKIFTPLFTTKAKGQGLGLAVVKKLVEELHGSINFESQIGYGTKFTITLPCTQR